MLYAYSLLNASGDMILVNSAAKNRSWSSLEWPNNMSAWQLTFALSSVTVWYPGWQVHSSSSGASGSVTAAIDNAWLLRGSVEGDWPDDETGVFVDTGAVDDSSFVASQHFVNAGAPLKTSIVMCWQRANGHLKTCADSAQHAQALRDGFYLSTEEGILDAAGFFTMPMWLLLRVGDVNEAALAGVSVPYLTFYSAHTGPGTLVFVPNLLSASCQAR